MWSLPVDDLYMVGHSSAARLKALGIRTIGELAATDPDYLRQEFKSHGTLMWEYANGIGDDHVHSTKREAKGIGNSTTLKEDARTLADAKRFCSLFPNLYPFASGKKNVSPEYYGRNPLS